MQDALAFAQQIALLAERHCAALRDFTGELGEAVALEVGCGVGGVAFELARVFPNVLALDVSPACINAARVGPWPDGPHAIAALTSPWLRTHPAAPGACCSPKCRL